MGIRKDCDIKPFVGYVVLKDPLPFIDVLKYEDAMEIWRESKMFSDKFSRAFPLLLNLVEEWHLERFPDNVNVTTWPGKPKLAAVKLFDWFIKQCADVYSDNSPEIDPNASGAEPTPTA